MVAIEDEKQLQMAKIKAHNTIRSGARSEAIIGFLEEVRRIPSCAKKLEGLKEEGMAEVAFLDDEEAFRFINYF